MAFDQHDAAQDTRRGFLKTAGTLAAGAVVASRIEAAPARAADLKLETLGLNGGPRTIVRSAGEATKWPLYGNEEIEAVTALLKKPSYAPVAELEQAWKAYFGCPFVKAHCNGTNALTSMWFALDLPAGSEVLIPNYSTWFPVVPMRFFDLVPVFVDVNPHSLNIDVEDCKRRITSKTRAIMPVHWFGVPCDMDAIEALAKEHGLVVVEDCSHAHGSKFQGKYLGNWGRIAGISLQMSKPLPSIEGGIAMYQERGDFERATTFGNYDLPETFPADSPYRHYYGTALGSKLRIHPVSAILARIQLKGLAERNAAGVAQMDRLNSRLEQLPGLARQSIRPEAERVFYAANLVMLDEKKAGMSRAKVVRALQAEGVECVEYPWRLLHTYPIFSETQWWRHQPVLPQEVPGCDEANRTVIRLPYFTSEQPELVDLYARAFEKVWAHRDELA